MKEVEEGRVVDGGRGRRHGDAQGRGGEAVGEGRVREDAGTGLGEGSGEEAGCEGLGGRPEAGLARCAWRGGSRGAGVRGLNAGCRGVLMASL